MSRIHKAFDHGKAFVAFLTAGDPSIEKTLEYVLAMEKAGADLIELGIPFSDPIAEGPVIQEADIRSLSAGTRLEDVFGLVEKIREHTQIPLVFLTYINPIVRYGKDRFFTKCQNAGIDGVIIPDMPYEERDECAPAAKAHGIDIISMIAPTSKERIRTIAKSGEGFLYIVSSLGVTGTRDNIRTDSRDIIEKVREVTDLPCAVGFGIHTPEQAKEQCSFADGAITGSGIVKLIAKYGADAEPQITAYVKKMKAGCTAAGQ